MNITRSIKKVGSSFLLVVFLFGTVPPEYLHDVFAGHHDGIDPILKKGEVVMMPKHTHCAFLSFVFAPFTVPNNNYFVAFETTEHHLKWVLAPYHFTFVSQHYTTSLRGPPCRNAC